MLPRAAVGNHNNKFQSEGTRNKRSLVRITDVFPVYLVEKRGPSSIATMTDDFKELTKV